ncbi:MAG TPA: amidohydrolase family protein [Acidimicrobiales bacterium]|nr:amidohydrolase family protein [Acidimicrobiales bacterium]
MAERQVIRGGTVFDGTGSPGVRADVAVRDGVIEAIGAVGHEDGDRQFDASGCIVSPGFIDIHTHYDAQVCWDPRFTPSSYHGVTTVVLGNCGFSIAPTRSEHRNMIVETLRNVEDMSPETLHAGVRWDFVSFPEYLEFVERDGIGLNAGGYLGHTPLRLYVMGEDAFERKATAEELRAMQSLLRQGLQQGAMGFSTSFSASHQGPEGKPIPSRLAGREEVLGLLEVVAEERRGLVAIVPGGEFPVESLYELQPTVGVPFTYGAILARMDGSHRHQLELNREGRLAGAEVWPQVTPRPLTFSLSMDNPFTLNPNPAFGELIGSSDVERRRAYESPAWRDRAAEGSDGQQVLVPRWDTYVVRRSTAHPEVEGTTIAAVARARGIHPVLALVDLALGEPGLQLPVTCIVANDDEAGVADILKDDGCTLGLSDAGAHVSQLCDAPQATDFLGRWVRDRQIMSLEKAIHRLTGRQAEILGIRGRGYLRPGYAADVAVFDFASVSPGPIREAHDFPGGALRLTAPEPTGVRHVFVNGVPIRVDEAQVESRDLPGRIVRPAVRPAA